MKNLGNFMVFVGASVIGVGGLMAAPCDPAHPLNNFCLASAGSSTVLDGVYISPYTAFVDGSLVQTQVICDDFVDEVQVGESWRATSANVGSASTGLFGSLNSTGYKEVAWLSQQLLLNPGNAGAISYAIWAVFQPVAVSTWLVSHGDLATPTAIVGLLAQAATHTGDDFSNVSVYTPVAGTSTCCGPPQEFVVVHTAEASALTTLGLDLSGFLLFAFALRRKFAPVR